MVAAFALIALVHPATADELQMTNGSRLIGTLISAQDDSFVFETPFAGRITVKEANVERIITDETVTLMLQDGRVLRDRRINHAEGSLVASADGADPSALTATDIKFLNPEPWRLGEGYKWSGTVGAAFESQRGNTDTNELDFAAESVWLSLRDRFTFRGSLERDKATDEKTSDKWDARTKYDRFMTSNPRNYRGGKLRFEYDRFGDLDLRTIVGPHVGRQLLDRPWLNLEGEVGPVWVDEQLNVSEDNDFSGALWELNAESDVIGFGTTLYVRHDGIFNFQDSKDLILNATIGIKMPLIFGLETAVEAKLEYNGGSADDVHDLDETYKLRLNYTW